MMGLLSVELRRAVRGAGLQAKSRGSLEPRDVILASGWSCRVGLYTHTSVEFERVVWAGDVNST